MISWYRRLTPQRHDLLRLLILVALVAFPSVGDLYLISELTLYIIYGIFAMSLSLMWGYAGIFSFGHAVFFGVGAYVMACVTKGMVPGLSGPLTISWIALILAVGSVAVLASILGYFFFYGRLAGAFLAIVTLSIAVIAERIAVGWDYIGAFNGLTDIPPLSFGGMAVDGYYSLFYFVLAVAVLVYLLCHRLVSAPFGIVLATIKGNETRAQFLGFDTAARKTIVFVISAAIAGLAGAIFAPVAQFVSPTLVGFGLSTEVLIWVALGGKEVLLAAFLGAITVRMLEAFLSDVMAYYWILALGFLFVMVVMYFPEGLFGRLLREPRESYGKAPHAPEEGAALASAESRASGRTRARPDSR